MRYKLLFLILFLSKLTYAIDPQFLWAKNFGGNGDDKNSIHTFSFDIDGNIIVTGLFNSTSMKVGSFTLTNNGGTDIFIVKLSSDGNVIWAKSFGGYSDENLHSVCCDNSGSIYINGTYRSSFLSFATYTLNNYSSYSHGYFLKLDKNGNVIWAKPNADNSNMSEDIFASCYDKNGYIYTSGHFADYSITSGTATVTNSYGSTSDILITKYDLNGNIIWRKSFGGSGNDVGFSMAINSIGEIIVSGHFTSTTINAGSSVFTNNNSSSTDVYIMKLNSAGTVLWAKSIGGNNNEYCYAITVDASDNIFMGGSFSSNSLALGSIYLSNQHPGIEKSFITKLDINGNIKWGKTNGDNSESDNIRSICIDETGGVLTAGYKRINSSNQGIILSKFDNNGNQIGEWTFLGTSNQYAMSVRNDLKGTYYMTGDFSGSKLTFDPQNILSNTSVGYFDFFISKFNLVCNSPIYTSTQFCPNESADLKAPNGYDSYSWINPSGNVFATTQSVTIKNPADKDVYKCNMGQGTCTILLTDTLKQYPDFNLKIIGDSLFCDGDSIELVASACKSYLWNTGATTRSIFVKKSGTYGVTGFSLNGCSKLSLKSITKSDLPDTRFKENPISLDNKNNTITCEVQYPQDKTEYTWDMGDGKKEYGEKISHSYNISFALNHYTITLTAKNNNSCETTEVKTVNVIPFIPNVFTPNNDGIEDRFMEGYDLKIIDRHGLEMYRGINGWDGTYKGNPAPPDTYFYYVTIKNNNEVVNSFNGYITLIR